MKRLLTWIVVLGSVAPSSHAQYRAPDGGGPVAVRQTIPCLTDAKRQEIRAQIERNTARLRAQGILALQPKMKRLSFGWPLRASGALTDPGYHGISGFVDHDLAYPGFLLDYECGQRTYDLSSGYNHSGTDFFLWPFSWNKMDNDEVAVVAVAPGTIVLKQDGHYDRSCSFGGTWNAVYVRHGDGSVAWYGHLKKGSLTSKSVGQTVAAGEYLGIVGSSGSSTGPHLHFEVYDRQGQLVDPYDGPCNSLNASSWWGSQRPYYDSAVNKVATHDRVPVFPDCPQPESPSYEDVFTPGETAYFAVYYRDQVAGQISYYRIYRPDNSLFRTWSHRLSEASHYSASYLYWTQRLPTTAPKGFWRFEVVYQGQRYSHVFQVASDDDTTCRPSATNLCLNRKRFHVEVHWRDFQDNTGSAQVVPYGSNDSGLFWFFDANNWEMLVKVLDGCGVNGNFWVFSAATTNVEYTLRVTDIEANVTKSYFNPLGKAASALTDTTAFGTCSKALDETLGWVETGTGAEADVSWPTAAQSANGKINSCRPGSSNLCLNRDRFKVKVDWRDFQGNTGSARVVPYGSDDSGIFWFFDSDNWEMLVKVLDGCGVNRKFWVFSAATTNVEYVLRVTDTKTNKVRVYRNPLGTAADAITDASAFATCP